jgi:hypothetical protein
MIASPSLATVFLTKLVNPALAQLKPVPLCRFLAVKDSASDALDFYDRAETG